MYITTGEPTVQEKAKLLIAALDLGSSPISFIPGKPIILHHNISVSRISRRDISAICGKPSSDIYTQSKCQ